MSRRSILLWLLLGCARNSQKICRREDAGCKTCRVDIAGEEITLVNACADGCGAGRQRHQGDADFALELTIDISAEGFAIVSSGDGVPAIKRVEMRSIAVQDDTVLFGTVADIYADNVETPLLVDDADFEHAA